MGAMLNPAMSGNMGFDPRMSMFGNMMGMGMPSRMGGLGPHMTGMSNFDTMASPGLGFANADDGGGMGMNASPNANELAGGAGVGSLGLQPPFPISIENKFT
jgi:hypothetical protein